MSWVLPRRRMADFDPIFLWYRHFVYKSVSFHKPSWRPAIYTIYIGYFYAQLKSSRYAFVIIINININININREIYIAPYGRNFRSVHGVHGATMKYPLTIFANLKKLLKIITQNFAQ